MDNYKEKTEQNILEIARQKEQADRSLLRVEILFACISIPVMLVLCIFASYVEMKEWLRITLILIGLLPIVVAIPFMIKIEQTAGYYECAECKHKYIPEYKSVFLSMHYGTTRYMKCPECGRKSWQKKVLTKE